MSAEIATVTMEKTRHVANLMQQGQFSLSVSSLVEVAKADPNLYKAVLKNLENYVLRSDLQDLEATVDMVVG
jgi:hypothetical protein